jgi:hypothetical protein
MRTASCCCCCVSAATAAVLEVEVEVTAVPVLVAAPAAAVTAAPLQPARISSQGASTTETAPHNSPVRAFRALRERYLNLKFTGLTQNLGQL